MNDITDFWYIPKFKENTTPRCWNQHGCLHRVSNTYEVYNNIESIKYNKFLYLTSNIWNSKYKNFNSFCRSKYMYIINFEEIKVDVGCKIFYSNAKIINLEHNSHLKYLIIPNCEKLTLTGYKEKTFKIIYAPKLKSLNSKKPNIFQEYGLIYAPNITSSNINFNKVINLTSVQSNVSYASYNNNKVQFYDNMTLDYDYIYKHSKMVEVSNKIDIFTIDNLKEFIESNNKMHYSNLFNILSNKTENYIKFILIQLFFSNQKNVIDDVKNLMFHLNSLSIENLISNVILMTQQPFQINPCKQSKFDEYENGFIDLYEEYEEDDGKDEIDNSDEEIDEDEEIDDSDDKKIDEKEINKKEIDNRDRNNDEKDDIDDNDDNDEEDDDSEIAISGEVFRDSDSDDEDDY